MKWLQNHHHLHHHHHQLQHLRTYRNRSVYYQQGLWSYSVCWSNQFNSDGRIMMMIKSNRSIEWNKFFLFCCSKLIFVYRSGDDDKLKRNGSVTHTHIHTMAVDDFILQWFLCVSETKMLKTLLFSSRQTWIKKERWKKPVRNK